MSSWGTLAQGDRIVDRNGEMWRVYAAPIHAVEGQPGHVVVGITDDTRRWIPVTKPHSEPVQTVPVDEEIANIERVFAPDRIELLATETVAEEAKRTGPPPRTYPHEEDMTTLKLRSHLYLLHAYETVGQLTNRMALLEHHRKCHDLPPKGTEHTHDQPH